MMLNDQDLFDAITNAALKGCDVDVKARKKAIWDAAVCLMADVLRGSDQLGRERMLRELVPELRASMDRLDQLLQPSPCNPFEQMCNPYKLN